MIWNWQKQRNNCEPTKNERWLNSCQKYELRQFLSISPSNPLPVYLPHSSLASLSVSVLLYVCLSISACSSVGMSVSLPLPIYLSQEPIPHEIKRPKYLTKIINGEHFNSLHTVRLDSISIYLSLCLDSVRVKRAKQEGGWG